MKQHTYLSINPQIDCPVTFTLVVLTVECLDTHWPTGDAIRMYIETHVTKIVLIEQSISLAKAVAIETYLRLFKIVCTVANIKIVCTVVKLQQDRVLPLLYSPAALQPRLYRKHSWPEIKHGEDVYNSVCKLKIVSAYVCCYSVRLDSN